jgi:cytochrome c-type biogenesis protein CcmH
MMFWVVAALLTAAVCMLLLRALAARPAESTRASADVTFYRAQMAEIARQHGLGLIGDAERRAAEAEAGRRLLAAGETADRPSRDTRGLEKAAALVLIVAVPALAFGAYTRFGSPAVPNQPLASRPPPAQVAGNTEGLPPDLLQAIARIESHLARTPDGRGYEVVAPVYLRLGRFDDAVRAYSEALRLLGPTADRHADLGEALAYQANGVVTAEAKARFLEALKLNAGHIKARMFSAMAAEQDGDRPRAIDLLTALARDLPEGELRGQVAARLAEIGGTAPPAIARVPEGGEAIAALPADQRAAAIRGMVENLSDRLASQGGSAEEWARLIRALAVLGETDRARAILGEARQKFAAKAEELRLIEDAAGALARTAP